MNISPELQKLISVFETDVLFEIKEWKQLVKLNTIYQTRYNAYKFNF
jgi:hypothetical protein